MARKYAGNRLNDEQKKIIKNYIESHPTNTFSDFKRDVSDDRVHCSDTHFYSARRTITGVKAAPRGVHLSKPQEESKDMTVATRSKQHSSPLYLTIWSYPSGKFTNEAKEVLGDFVQKLNSHKGARFEIIELKSPEIVEIREIAK